MEDQVELKPVDMAEATDSGLVDLSMNTRLFTNGSFGHSSTANNSPAPTQKAEDVESSDIREKRPVSDEPDMKARTCQVCADTAVGFHCDAYVCEACKKFFLRSIRTDGASNVRYNCVKNDSCVVNRETRSRCPACRLAKCKRIGMKKSASKAMKMSHIPCMVCSAPSSGFHFGAITCEGCKGFFRRCVKNNEAEHIRCNRSNNCSVTASTRNSCKACRFYKCTQVGMSLQASRIGRQSNALKQETIQQFKLQVDVKNEATDTSPQSTSVAADIESNMEIPDVSPDLLASVDEETLVDMPLLNVTQMNRQQPGEQTNTQHLSSQQTQHSPGQQAPDKSTNNDHKNRKLLATELPVQETKLIRLPPGCIKSVSPTKPLTDEECDWRLYTGAELEQKDEGAPWQPYITAFDIAVKLTEPAAFLHELQIASDGESAWKNMQQHFGYVASNFIKASKSVPDFCDLLIDDQVSLIRQNVFGCCSSTAPAARRSLNQPQFFSVHDVDLAHIVSLFPEFSRVVKVYKDIQHFVYSLSLDRVEHSIFFVLALTLRTSIPMKYPEKRDIIRYKACVAYGLYCQHRNLPRSRINKLMLLLPELRIANHVHREVIGSISRRYENLPCHPLFLELYLQEIMSTNKDIDISSFHFPSPTRDPSNNTPRPSTDP